MEEKREPLSEMAIERKIQILRNKHMDSEVIALVKSDYEYGLTDDEIDLYLNKSYDIEQMKVLSKCLHKHVGTRQSSRLLYRPVYKEVFSPPGVTDEPQNVFHDALLNY